MGARNLSFTAGTTVALDKNTKKLFNPITLNTAKILKIDHLVGSISKKVKCTSFLLVMEML